jgi:hypothetical protein
MQKSNAPERHQPVHVDWRRQRRSGLVAIIASAVAAACIWLAIRYFAPLVPNMASLADRLVFAFKYWCIALLLCFATGIDAVAHERLQSPAFDPLLGYETKRLRINLRYLQNTLEQLILFTAALFGLALYSPGGDVMRAVEATAIVWILFRFAFWIGYHRNAAMRSMGAAGIALSLVILIYVVARISLELGGPIAMMVVLGAFAAVEAVLFWTTRARKAPGDEPVKS